MKDRGIEIVQRADKRSSSFAITFMLCFQVAVLILPSSFCYAAAPEWWTSRGVIQQGATPNDYTPAVAGQLKNLAVKAKAELDQDLAGGAGSEVDAVVAAFSQLGNYQAINAGQLKNVAKPFWTRLIQVGYASNYPWAGIVGPVNDYARVNIGQVKNLFSFDLSNFDADHDGLPDWWERQWFGNIGMTDAYSDYDHDGLSNLDEYFDGSDPTYGSIYYTDTENNPALEVTRFYVSPAINPQRRSLGVFQNNTVLASKTFWFPADQWVCMYLTSADDGSFTGWSHEGLVIRVNGHDLPSPTSGEEGVDITDYVDWSGVITIEIVAIGGNGMISMPSQLFISMWMPTISVDL